MAEKTAAEKAADEKKAAAEKRAAAQSSGAPERAARDAVEDHGPVMADAAEALVERAARSEQGLTTEPEPVLPVDEQIRRAEERAGTEDGREVHLHVASLTIGGATLTSDKPVTPEPHPAPGETERGWSPEVTARHPVLLAETMEELAGVDKRDARARRGPRISGIDPTDVDALNHALSEEGFREVRKTMLTNDAIRLNSDRLAAAQESASRETGHHSVAMQEAVEEAREQAATIGFRDGKRIDPD